MFLLNNLILTNYSYEFILIETTPGDNRLYIANYISYKCLNDLNIYNKNELEKTFIETVNLKKSNIIVGVIYRQPSMDLTGLRKNTFTCFFSVHNTISLSRHEHYVLGSY